MKAVAAPIDMLAWGDYKGTVHPIRFRYESRIIRIDKVVTQGVNKFAGKNMLVFVCQGRINEEDHLFELRYEVKTCKWMLFKIEHILII